MPQLTVSHRHTHTDTATQSHTALRLPAGAAPQRAPGALASRPRPRAAGPFKAARMLALADRSCSHSAPALVVPLARLPLRMLAQGGRAAME